LSISLQFRKNKIKSASWNWTGNPKREREREREREITRFLFELIKNNIGGFIFFFGAFKASNEREDFVECFGFDVVASDFALFLNFLLRWSIHRFFLSLSLSLSAIALSFSDLRERAGKWKGKLCIRRKQRENRGICCEMARFIGFNNVDFWEGVTYEPVLLVDDYGKIN